jgi:hypothetical protein
MTAGRILGASTDASFDQKLAALASQLRGEWAIRPPLIFSGPAASTPVRTQTFAAAQKIDNLSGTSLSNISVNGVSGLTDAVGQALDQRRRHRHGHRIRVLRLGRHPPLCHPRQRQRRHWNGFAWGKT